MGCGWKKGKERGERKTDMTSDLGGMDTLYPKKHEGLLD